MPGISLYTSSKAGWGAGSARPECAPGRPQAYVILGVLGREPGMKPRTIENPALATMAEGPAAMLAKLSASLASELNAAAPALVPPPANFETARCAIEALSSVFVPAASRNTRG